MKKILALIILSVSGLSFADGNNDWQKIDENIIKLNSLNACQGCLLRNANFVGADFKNAVLSGADFISADLSSANFYNADLEGSSFFGAEMNGSNLENKMYNWVKLFLRNHLNFVQIHPFDNK